MVFTPIRAGDEVSDETALRIFAGMTGKFLPKEEWTHPAHLVFATVLLDREGLSGAEAAAPDLIRNYNISVGGVNSDTEGYHHTITLFFLRRIDMFLASVPEKNIGARATRVLASPLAETDYPMRFYSRERLFSVEARRSWVEPDL